MQIIQQKMTPAEFIEFDTSTLTLDDMLVFDLYIKKGNDYVIIIEAGTQLSQILFDKLARQDAIYILKDDEYKTVLCAKSLMKYIEYNNDNFQKTIQLLYSINNTLFDDFMNSDENQIDNETIKHIVKAIIYLIEHNKHYLKDTIPHLSNEYSIAYHSLHVTLYAIHLGHVLKLSAQEIVQLGIAALLHDTGSKSYEDSIKHKDDVLSEEEIKEVHQHPKLSCEIATKNRIHDPYILDAIRHHHEALDGSGYPNELQKNEISTLASVLAICDVFDALTNKRSYRVEYSSFDALKLMMRDEKMINRFNQQYLRAFLHSLSK